MRLSNSVIGNMLMLYAGKTSSLLVAFVFLPFYNRLLGPEQFGIVAVILSLQALLVMMDLGMSTLVSREVAVASTTGSACLKLLRTAELSLTIFYSILLIVAFLATNVGLLAGVDPVLIIGAVILFWLLVLQNLYYSSLIARRDFAAGSFIQVAGVAMRAAATAYVLSFYSATLQAFILTQIIFGGIHWWVSRVYCMKKVSESETDSSGTQWPRLSDAIALTRTGGALVLFSAAGAAVTQLDKPIISMFVSAASVAPYYLASLLCMTPISILASPVSQYFQPLFLKEAVKGFSESAKKLTGRFVYSIFVVTAIPTLVLWWFRVPIIDIWVGGSSDNGIISRYVEILLPGLAVGALGFVPYNFLIFAKDFRFQAIFSASMTSITLGLVAIAAMKQNVEAVCIIYSLYHVCSTLGSWVRAIIIPEARAYARYSGAIAISLTILLLSLIGFVRFLLF